MQCLGKQTIRGSKGTHQHHCHNDDGDVAVNNGGKTPGKAALQCTIQRFAVFQLFLDALCSDNIGVHAHADRQNDTGNTGQSQGKAFKHREVAGDECQRCRHLTCQCDAGNKARQTVQHRHEHHDESKGNDACQHHGSEAILAQTGADSGIAVHRQRKGQSTGIDLTRHLDDSVLGEGVGYGAGDDCLAVRNGSVDRCGADIFIVQPDADGAPVPGKTGGGITKRLCTLCGKLQRHIVFCRGTVYRTILCCSVLDHRAVQNQLPVLAAAFPEGQIGGGADLFNGSFRVKIRFAGLPRELQDQAVRTGVHIQLIVGNIQCHQTIFNDQLRRFQLLLGGIVVLRGHKGDVDAALDVHTEPDILCPLDVGGGHIAILCRHAEERRVGKDKDQQRRDEQLPCFTFCLHIIRKTSKRPGRAGPVFYCKPAVKRTSSTSGETPLHRCCRCAVSVDLQQTPSGGAPPSESFYHIMPAVQAAFPPRQGARRRTAAPMRSPPRPDWDRWVRYAGENPPGPCGRDRRNRRR